MERTLSDIIDDIRHSWETIPIPARFYLEDLESITEVEYELLDGHVFLVNLFLDNAHMWQGGTASILKKELKNLIS